MPEDLDAHAGNEDHSEPVSFPRPSKGSASQHLVVTMLADYWREADAWLPSRLILALAADLDLSASATSTALSRLGGRGVLEQSNAGRASRYRFTEAAKRRLRVGFRQVSEFGAENRRWDRTWTVVAFTIPESARELRELLRSRLKWLGFAPLYGALWVSAWDTADELESSCRAFGVDNYVIFRTAESELRGKPLIQAWELDELQKQYTPFIETYGPRAAESHGGIGLREAFRLRTEAMDAWRAFPWNDPGLPSELLPETFPLFEARQAFVGLYDSLADAALEHTQEVVRAIAPELGGAAKATRIGQG